MKNALPPRPTVQVHLAQILADHAEGRAEHRLSGDTVGQVLAALTARYPDLRAWIWTAQGAFNPMLAAFLNQENIAQLGGLDAPVGEGDELMVVSALEGG
ncbi:MAG: MoaD/ThiS family protein [Deltaproteobacteria bacterium]|nr:MoaD/ThiS family protein [Deltaproteobacteria bacterium]